jgi:hypothetical protein
MSNTELATLIGAGASLFGLIAQGAVFAFFLGKLSARVNGVETRARDVEDRAAALAAMIATLQALKESVDDIKVTFSRRFEAVEHTVNKLMMVRGGRARATATED